MADFLDRAQKYLLEQLERLSKAEDLARMIREIPQLVDSIRKNDPRSCLGAVSGLMTIPDLQPNLIRLESLAHLLAARANGEIDPTREALEKWLNEDLGAHIVTNAEDPVEDVFASNVVTGLGNRRIFTGIWDTPDFWLQSLLD